MFYVAFLEVAIDKIIKILSVSVFLAATIGIYDIVAINYSFPTFSYDASPIQITSGFQHFGTAADYIQIMLSILIPFQISEYYDGKKRNVFDLTSLFLGLIFLIGTGRVSVIISFLFSLVLLFIVNIQLVKIKKILMYVGFSAVSLFLFFALIPSFFNNLIYRINSRILERQAHSLEADFFVQNGKASLQLFAQNPIHGVGFGIGHFKLDEFDFSIHGTFFKLLAETGMLGFLGYIVFIIAIFKFVYSNCNNRKSFFYQMLPMLFGIFISSIYNTHFLRIEFWVLLATILVFVNKTKSTRNIYK
ncbi:O-antigen ligase family protein [Flavobacterium sp.]|uniref:O-antigen ligase family protein n=1 Tax=Flavobacterium sp. TaxID=239 RepID=UPI00261E9F78|nr:O-antigen ligase family protein [Flavobacterium sp.]